MKEQIEKLIAEYKIAKQEVVSFLEELNQINSSKLDYKEDESLRETKAKYLEELYWRSVFINELEDLL